MNVREAILAAADHIETYPKKFSFASVEVPSRRSCGTPGCALGWIGHFAGSIELARANKNTTYAALPHIRARERKEARHRELNAGLVRPVIQPISNQKEETK